MSAPNSNIDYEVEINRLRKDMNAVILAHYYQEDEIQDLADYVGDSLDLIARAKKPLDRMLEMSKLISP